MAGVAAARGGAAAGGLTALLDQLLAGFSGSLQELRTVTLLRLEDSALDIFEKDVTALQKSVRALESKVKDVREYVATEKRAIKKVEEVVRCCEVQTLHLGFIADNLPQHLPQAELREAGGAPAAQPQGCGPLAETDAAACDAREAHAGEKKKRPQSAPRRYVSEAEYGSLSGYMTQRLPLSKVNTAIDEAADLAEGNMRMLALAKSGGKLGTQEWKRAQALLVNIAGKDGVKGRCWLMDADLRKASVLKPDKTGKAIMTILRHLGRVHEARLPLHGKLDSVYTLQDG